MNKTSLFATTHNMWRSAVGGFLSLCAVNLSAAFTGVSLGFGWLSGATAVLLGVPGVIGLLALNALFSLA